MQKSLIRLNAQFIHIWRRHEGPHIASEDVDVSPHKLFPWNKTELALAKELNKDKGILFHQPPFKRLQSLQSFIIQVLAKWTKELAEEHGRAGRKRLTWKRK